MELFWPQITQIRNGFPARWSGLLVGIFLLPRIARISRIGLDEALADGARLDGACATRVAQVSSGWTINK